jgi:exopolysaccharide biosynthesis polyprenyl glycosylphosphotransferase
MSSELGLEDKAEHRAVPGHTALEGPQDRESRGFAGAARGYAGGELPIAERRAVADRRVAERRVTDPDFAERGFVGLGIRRRAPLEPIAETAPRPSAATYREWLFRRALLGADMFAIVLAFVLTVALSSRSLQLTWMSIIGLPILVVCAKMLGLYDRDEVLLRKTTLDEVPKLFEVATLCTLVASLAGGLIVDGALDRREALFLWLTLTALLILVRTLARALALHFAPTERCLFIGDAELSEAIRGKLTSDCGVKAEMVSHLDLDMIGSWSTDACSDARLSEVRELARELDVHRAIVAPDSADPGEMLDLMRTLKAVGVRVSVLPRLLEVVGSSVEFDDLHGVTLMGVRRFELSRSSATLKRAFDLLGASLMLAAAAPLMAIIAIAIKLDSPSGPVFFRQLRVGRHGRRFYVFKFRTMVPNAEALKDALRDRNEAREGLFKIADDPRVTRVGRLLRKSALDELPQLLNIVKGEMGLVGPRPLVVEEDRRIQGWHRRRLELTPGMTGPWQILGPARSPLREMAVMDYLYVANWSLWTDIKILLRTFSHVIRRRGL